MQRSCDVCGAEYTAKREAARYCSTRCRTRASRARKAGTVVPMQRPPRPQPAVEVGSVLEATRRVLDDADRADTPMGRAALALAARIDSKQDTGSALATAVRGLDEAMQAAMRGVQRSGSVLDLKARRDARRNA